MFAEIHVSENVCSADLVEGRTGCCGCTSSVFLAVLLLNVPQSKDAMSSERKDFFF